MAGKALVGQPLTELRQLVGEVGAQRARDAACRQGGQRLTVLLQLTHGRL